MADAHHNVDPHQVKVAVVGPCASGKSTLVRNLRELGYSAFVVAQEHSAVPGLWNHQHPDVLIALQADLATIRLRRGAAWSRDIYEAQLQRLQAAYDSADLVVDTGKVSETMVVEQALEVLRRRS